MDSPTQPLPTLEQLRYRHPQHQQFASHWNLLDAIVAGGHRMNDSMKRSILANPDGRPLGVQNERVKLSTYCNKIGPILTRFNSELFAESASKIGSKDAFWKDIFFPGGAILQGDDDARASFDTFLSDAMLQALATGKAIAQVDTAIASGQANALPDQQALGELEPRVLLHPRDALWDWDSDNLGFKFAKLQQFRMVRSRWNTPPVPEHDFTIYERVEDGTILASRYTIRKRLKGSEKQPTGPLDLGSLKEADVDITVILEPSPIFSVNGKFKFPIMTLTLPETLWMADQLLECQKSYYNQTAALEWGIFTSNYAMPVVSGVDDAEDDPFNSQKLGDGYYLTLKTGQSLTWAERAGGAFATATTHRAEIKRDIYDILQQIAMSAADGAAISARSGASKKEDRRPTQLLLDKYGDLIREFAKQILDAAALIHNEDVDWKIDGYKDFMGDGLLEDITDFQGVQSVQVPSLTFKRETAKRFATRVGQAMSIEGDKLKIILAEVDQAAAPDFLPPAPAAPEAAPEAPDNGNGNGNGKSKILLAA